jgi:hypothetical protein
MKKLWIGLLAFVPLLFSGCSDEITQVVLPNTFTHVYQIYAEDMSVRTDVAGTYYEYEWLEPALTDEVFDYGVMQAFLYYNKDGHDTLCPLPFSDFMTETDANGKVTYQWEEHFTIEFQPGALKFIQKISDHSSEKPASEYYDVMVRFMW